MNTKLSSGMLRKFAKDYAIPINVFHPREVFDYFLDLYDPLYDCKKLFNVYCDAIADCGGEAAFTKHSRRVIDNIIDDIKSTESYSILGATKNPTDYEPMHQISKENIYHPDYDDKTLISIDLKKANYNSFRTYDESLVLDTESYEELVGRYTKYDYLIKSKVIRQVVFGNLLPKKQQSIQKTYMSQICDNIMTEYPYFKLALAGTDEVIVLEYGDNTPIEAYQRVLDCIPSIAKEANMITAEVFTLEKVHPEKSYFIKKPWDIEFSSIEDTLKGIPVEGKLVGFKSPSFKNVPSLFFAQVYKNYFNLPVNDTDLLFVHEGCVAYFRDGIYDTQVLPQALTTALKTNPTPKPKTKSHRPVYRDGQIVMEEYYV
jgi:hypothetical protein